MTFDEFVQITIGDPEVMVKRRKIRPHARTLLFVVDELNSFNYVCRKLEVESEGQYDNRTEWFDEIFKGYCNNEYPTRWSISKKVKDTTAKDAPQVALIVIERNEGESFDDWRVRTFAGTGILDIVVYGFCFVAHMTEDSLHVD